MWSPDGTSLYYVSDRSGSDELYDWHETIKKKLTLDELSRMYVRGDKPFTSFDEVPLPEIATFAGLPGEVQDLEGDWYVKQEPNKGDGLAAQWWNADISSGWDKLHMPGSVFWFKYNTGNRELPKWVIRDFDYDPAKANGKPVYLYDFARATVNDPRNLMPVYLNGEKLGDVASWTAWDVSKLLKPGKNRLAFECEVFTGRVLLSTDTPALYPYLGADRNKLWVTFNDWLIDGRWGAVNNVLAGMRMVEPNKPIKIMAPPGNDNDRWLDAASKYGAWGHFTGEGIWGFFWYKRYGFLYGLPGTSEGAGPAASVRDQFNVYERIMLEGLNGHDTVFNVQNITAVPGLKKWFEDHMAVIKQMGRYDIAGPQVILYRSANQASAMMPPPTPALPGGDSHQIQSIWNWDFARGTFQEIGQSGLYVDNGGLATHKIDRYKIMLDAGDEIVTDDALKNIGDWVKNGGTFITLPFTGRSSVAAPDSWPIQQLTGCTVSKMRKPGDGTVTIAKDQPIFKDLAGQTFPDAGKDKDWQDVEYNLLSTELKPGADCTVLATFEDGAPAIVMHKLGKGRVISLGSVFFRDVQDKQGLWMSGEGEEKFLRDLLNGLGQPAVNYTTDLQVLAQRYRTQNGLDDVVVMQNFSTDDKTVDLHVTLDHPPAKVYQAAMSEVKEVPFTINGNEVTISSLAIPHDETQVFFLRGYTPDEAVAHWWQYQNKLWKPTEPTKLDFSAIDHGRWIDPTVDLKQDWYWTQADQAGDDWKKEGGRFSVSGNDGSQPWVLDIFTAVGADSTKPLFARRAFTIKPEWLKDGGTTMLRQQGQFFDFRTWGTRSQLWVNGQEVKGNYENVTALLKPGRNVVAIRLDPQNGCQYLGIQGSLYLSHARPPVKTVELSGSWTNDIGSTGAPVTFPGKADAFAPSRVMDIPADWKDKYVICYYVEGDPGSTSGMIVNESGAVGRRNGGPAGEFDITPYLKFGEKNTLSMLSTDGDQLDPSHKWDVSKVELHLYPKSEYRN